MTLCNKSISKFYQEKEINIAKLGVILLVSVCSLLATSCTTTDTAKLVGERRTRGGKVHAHAAARAVALGARRAPASASKEEQPRASLSYPASSEAAAVAITTTASYC